MQRILSSIRAVAGKQLKHSEKIFQSFTEYLEIIVDVYLGFTNFILSGLKILSSKYID